MDTILSLTKKGIIPKEVEQALKYDPHLSKEDLAKKIAEGKAVIPKNNIGRSFQIKAIGEGLTTKINANIGTSVQHYDIKEELLKLDVAIKYGADSVMDLSTGGPLRQIRKEILKNSTVMVGAVPLYETMARKMEEGKPLFTITADEIFEDIERQCKEGIDYITVHVGVTKKSIEVMMKSKRILGVVSRGGSMLASWVIKTGKENPLYEQFDRLVEIAKKYDVTLSLGDAFRPGSIVDATDRGQIQELITLGELAHYAQSQGVQVMIEGPGHVPLNEIKTNMDLQKKLTNGAPFYVLGPLVTDVAPGYDHITSAIGGAIAATYGANFLCYVTPAEHLMLPTIDDVRLGVIAAKIAAHSADVARGIPHAIEKDYKMSYARYILDWNAMFDVAIDPIEARKRKSTSEAAFDDVCTMCGDLCAIKTFNEAVTGQKDKNKKLSQNQNFSNAFSITSVNSIDSN